MSRSTLLASRIAVLLLPLLFVACKPQYPACEADKDCKEHSEFCVNKQCQQCRDTKDCKAGQECKAGRCETKKNVCSDDSQCPAGQSCLDGVCKACASDNECGTGGKCNQGRCQRTSSTGDDGSNNGNGNGGPPTECKCEVIFFDFNESGLSNDATAGIERNAECLKKVGTRSVGLAGYTDPRGTEEYNLALSDKRAQSVKDRLVRLGTDGGRIRVIPKGETDAVGTDESGWAKDRKVECQW